MNINQSIGTFLVVSCLLGTGLAYAQEPAGAAPDNTTVNQRDRNAAEPTADRQKDNRSDREITQQVRKAIMNDKSLSTYGHNVKVVTQNGQVTLKGPVRSDDEKRAIETKAAEVAGEGKVTGELDIKSKN